MFKELLQSVSGIEILGIISMLFFFLIFMSIIYWSVRVDRDYIKKMEEMPLETGAKNGE